MKTLKFKLPALIIFILIACLGLSCRASFYSTGETLPPGQMKKATGSKSAKPFAPGQRKK